jgi:hypothetical protein
VQITYSAADISGIDEAAIMLVRLQEDGQWQDAACGPYDRDLQNNRLAVPVCWTGRFAFVEAHYSAYLPSLLAK